MSSVRRADAGGHFQGFVQAKVRRVGAEPQAVQDQHVQPREQRPTFGRNFIGIRAIGQVAKAEAQHAKPAVIQPDRHDSLPQHLERVGRDAMELQPGDRSGLVVLGPRVKRIIERFADAGLDLILAEQRELAVEIIRKQPDVVQSIDMVHMIVRKQGGVDQPDAFPQQLRPQVRRRVDQQIALGQSQRQAAPQPAIARVAAHARLATTANDRHADAGARAEKNQLAGNVRSHGCFL